MSDRRRLGTHTPPELRRGLRSAAGNAAYRASAQRGPSGATASRQGDERHSSRRALRLHPFRALCRGLEQELFSDGITDDIITDLAKVSRLFVLGRNTVFTYKGHGEPGADRQSPILSRAALVIPSLDGTGHPEQTRTSARRMAPRVKIDT
jgi:hypothetical protein